jgi:hypothetical protein
MLKFLTIIRKTSLVPVSPSQLDAEVTILILMVFELFRISP